MNPILIAVSVAAAVLAAGKMVHDYRRASHSTANVPPTPVPCGVAPCPLANGAMTPERAQRYMDEFKQLDIPWPYVNDCCYARAQKMCGIMERDGYSSQKTWYAGYLEPIEGSGNRVMRVDAPNEPLIWGYHVAPVVQVQQPNGTVIPMVLDPSMSNRPLTVDEWHAQCGPGGTISTTTDSSSGHPFNHDNSAIIPRNQRGDFTEALADKALAKHRRSLQRATNSNGTNTP